MAVWKCTVCGEKAYSQEDCSAHLTASHPDVEEKGCMRVAYRCSTCGRVYGHWSDAKNHGHREHGQLKPQYEEIEAVPA